MANNNKKCNAPQFSMGGNYNSMTAVHSYCVPNMKGQTSVYKVDPNLNNDKYRNDYIRSTSSERIRLPADIKPVEENDDSNELASGIEDLMGEIDKYETTDNYQSSQINP